MSAPKNLYKRKEWIEKLRKKATGLKKTQKTKNKIRQKALKQFINGMPEETKEKIRKKLEGRRLTEKHRRNISKNLPDTFGKNNNMYGKTSSKHPRYIKKPTFKQLIRRIKQETHNYVNIMNGPARYYSCIDCNKSANEWSNINNHVYRKNVNDYKPRCCSCHKKYDKKLNNIKIN